jgi:RHS repeat-associated protein
VLHKLGTTTLDGASYTYDNAENRKTRTDNRLNTTLTYGFDNIYQLQTAKQGSTSKESYTYDIVGNRLTSQIGSQPVTTYMPNTSNELMSTTNPTVSYTYDNNGSVLTKSDGTQYTWDYENELTQVTLPSPGGTVNFKYDPFGRRIQKSFTQSGTTTTTDYLYDGVNRVEDVDVNGNLLARYVHGRAIDEPLEEVASGTTSYYQQDGIGSVSSLSNSAGALTNTYTYDSYGKLTASTGTLANPFRYTAREFDPETGLYEYRARYYDQNIGRFLSEDPIGFDGGINFYAYVDNDPTMLVDPFGFDGGPWHPPDGVHTKCLPTDECPAIRGKMWLLQRMIDSHTGWDQNMLPPRGGNRHSIDIGQLWAQYAECQALYLEKCKDKECKNKSPQSEPTTEPQSNPAPIITPTQAFTWGAALGTAAALAQEYGWLALVF